jgi:RNA polymerase sigma-70 factor (ECF subfamily)
MSRPTKGKPVDEVEAIARLRRCDLAGLEFVVRTYQDQAKRTAYLITGDSALAEDIVQSAFLRAYEEAAAR